MPIPKKGARLGGSASHQRKILSNSAAQLFEYGSIKTTDAKAKQLRPYAEKLITKAKRGTLADRRNVLKDIPNKEVVAHLFDDLAPQFENRNGGYTRIVKLDNRKGDNAPMSQISLVLGETASADSARAARAAASQKASASESAENKAETTDSDAPAKKTTAKKSTAKKAPAKKTTKKAAAKKAAPKADEK